MTIVRLDLRIALPGEILSHPTTTEELDAIPQGLQVTLRRADGDDLRADMAHEAGEGAGIAVAATLNNLARGACAGLHVVLGSRHRLALPMAGGRGAVWLAEWRAS